MRSFKKACKEKHDKGKAEHQQEWSNDAIDVISELQGECEDIFNYCDLLKELDPRLATEMREEAEVFWTRLELKRKTRS